MIHWRRGRNSRHPQRSGHKHSGNNDSGSKHKRGSMITGLTLALGVFLVIVGTTHFLFPRYYVELVPPWLPHPRLLVLASGACEIAIGAALWVEATRALAGWAAVGLMGVYVLTHVDALGRARPDSPRWLERPTGALARVIVNLAYLAWALVVAVG